MTKESHLMLAEYCIQDKPANDPAHVGSKNVKTGCVWETKIRFNYLIINHSPPLRQLPIV